jgi:chitinase
MTMNFKPSTLSRLSLLGLIACLPLATAEAKPKKPVLAFYTSWDPAGGIDYNKVTHILFAFTNANSGGSVTGYVAGGVVSAAHAAGVKVMASIGGANNSSAFPGIAANSGSRSTFASNVKALCDNNNLDGVDIDWEFPENAQDSANFTLLMKQLRTTLGTRVISVDVAADAEKGQWIPKSATTIPDFFNIMSYDFVVPSGGGFIPTQHAPYSKASTSLNYWRVRGVPKDRCILGVPFYGHNYDAGGTTEDYKAIINSNPGLSPDADSIGHNYFNGVTTIKKKATLVAQQSYGGIMIWQIAQDMPSGSRSLLDALNSGLEADPVVSIASVSRKLPTGGKPGMQAVDGQVWLTLTGSGSQDLRASAARNVLGRTPSAPALLLKGSHE